MENRMPTPAPEFSTGARASRIRTAMPPGAGLLCCALLAAVSLAADRQAWLQSHGLGALTLAIILGIVVGNLVPRRRDVLWAPGITIAKQQLLRAGIVLYGLRLTFQDIAEVGWAGVLIDVLMLSTTFGLALVIGTRLFKLERSTAMLIGAGSAICGAAAVVLRVRASQVTVAMATVVVFGTGAIFLYPQLYRLDLQWHLLGAGGSAFGIYAGSTIHEVAQVLAAGRAIGGAAADTAVIAKMVRVMLLAPFLIMLSAFAARSAGKPQERPVRFALPWFALAFIAAIALHSLFRLPPPLLSGALQLDTFLLAMAMAGLGLGTDRAALREAGIKPLLLGALLFCWLIGGGAAINRIVPAFLA